MINIDRLIGKIIKKDNVSVDMSKHKTMQKQTDPFYQYKGMTVFDNISPAPRYIRSDKKRLAMLLNDANEEHLEDENRKYWKIQKQKKRISDEMHQKGDLGGFGGS